MSSEKKSERQIFIDGDVDGLPIDLKDIETSCVNDKGYLDVDLSEDLGITDNIYILFGLDFRWLKRFNPKNHVIF